MFRICDEKESDLVLLAVLCSDLVQLGMTAMGDENVVKPHDLVDLALVQMFQALDRSIGCNAHDEQPAVSVRVGEP